MRRLAMRSALAAKRRANELIVLDELTLPFPRTKEMVRVLEALGIEKGALFVLAERDPAVLRATANLPKVEAVSVNEMNLLDVLRLPQLVMTRAAVELATQRLTAPIDRRPRVVRLAAAAAGEAAG
jgi:large subunit ribosomal protein L4